MPALLFLLLPALLRQDAAALIERLGDEDIAVRDGASRELRSRLGEAEPFLQAGLRHADGEVQARCADLLRELAILRRPPPPAIVGKIAFVHEAGRLVAIDRRPRNGARVGERLDVYREGRRVGRVEITDAQAWGSWVRACDGTDFATLKKGDAVAPAMDP